jgi:hypothetical protein
MRDLIHVMLHAIEIIEGLREEIEIALDITYQVTYNNI